MSTPPRGKRRGRPKGASSEDTYEAIIVAARVAFGRRGYDMTRVRDVAEAAEVTTSSVYHYFSDKRTLYISVFRDAERVVAELYKAALAGSASPVAGMRDVLEAAVELHKKDDSYNLFLSAVPIEMRRHRDIAKGIAACPIAVEGILRNGFARWADERGVDSAEADHLARLFYAVTSGVALYAKPGTTEHASMLHAFRPLLDP